MMLGRQLVTENSGMTISLPVSRRTTLETMERISFTFLWGRAMSSHASHPRTDLNSASGRLRAVSRALSSRYQFSEAS